MAWVKLDEKFASHPKVVEVGPLGLALQVAALCYCNQHLTDGHISLRAARTLLDFDGLTPVEDVIERLVEVGMWHGPIHDCTECPEFVSGYVIHGYLEQQPSKAEVEAKKEQASEAGRRGGLAKAKRTAKRKASEPLSGSPSGSLAKVCPDTDTDTENPNPPATLEVVHRQPGGGDLVDQARDMARRRLLAEKQQAGTGPNSPDKWLAWHERDQESDWPDKAAGFLANYPSLTATQLADCLLGRTNILRSLRRVS